MPKFKAGLRQIVVAVVVLAIVGGGVYYIFFRGNGTKTVTARFPEAVGIYPDTPVSILGVDVGTVTSIHPHNSYVDVTMSYDAAYQLPKNVKAVEQANSLVADRSIDLSPAFKTGDTPLANGATLGIKDTSGPAELDQIYSALNNLSKELGPDGANKGGKASGPLSALINVSAANLKGNGTAIGQSITNLAAAAKTLADNRGNLFTVVGNLNKFTLALKASDTQVRSFNTDLATVAGQLAAEREDLGAALHDLAYALDKVHTFVSSNSSVLHSTISNLADISSVLNEQKASLRETLAVAPIALANIVHSYAPNIGALGTRSNLSSLTEPSQFCLLLDAAGELTSATGSGLLSQIGQAAFGKVSSYCTAEIGMLTKSAGATVIQGILNSLEGAIGGGSTGGLSAGGTPSFPIGGSS